MKIKCIALLNLFLINTLCGCGKSRSYVTLSINCGIGSFSDRSFTHTYKVLSGTVLNNFRFELPTATNLLVSFGEPLVVDHWLLGEDTIPSYYTIDKDTSITASFYPSTASLKSACFAIVIDAFNDELIQCLKDSKPCDWFTPSKEYITNIFNSTDTDYAILGTTNFWVPFVHCIAKTGEPTDYISFSESVLQSIFPFKDQRVLATLNGWSHIIKEMTNNYLEGKSTDWIMPFHNLIVEQLDNISGPNASGIADSISAFAKVLSKYADEQQEFFEKMYNAWNVLIPYISKAKTSLCAQQSGSVISAFCSASDLTMGYHTFYDSYDYLINNAINALDKINNNY